MCENRVKKNNRNNFKFKENQNGKFKIANTFSLSLFYAEFPRLLEQWFLKESFFLAFKTKISKSTSETHVKINFWGPTSEMLLKLSGSQKLPQEKKLEPIAYLIEISEGSKNSKKKHSFLGILTIFGPT